MGVNRGSTGKSRASSSATANRLVVLISAIAERKIVHCSLASRQNVQSAIKCVRDGLRCFHVPGNNCRRRFWRQHRAFRNDNIERRQATVIQRGILLDQWPENIENRRLDDR